MKYTVALRKTNEGVSVRCIDLPGCWSEGANEEEALGNIKEAIAVWIDTKRELDAEITDGATVREIVVAP